MKPSNSLNVSFHPSDTPVTDCVDLLADAGYTSLDFNFWDWACYDTPFTGESWRDWVRSAVERAAERSAKFTQAHAPVHDFSLPHDEFADELCRRAILGCEMAGIEWIVFHPISRDDLSEEENFETNRSYFAGLCAFAADHGVGIALENLFSHGSKPHFTASSANLLRLVEAIGTPNVGICWDTGHALINGLDQYAELKRIGTHLKALHLQDGDGKVDLHYCPFYGKCDWKGITRALAEIGYANDLTFEIASFVRPLPSVLRPKALELCLSAGNELLRMVEKSR